MVIAMSRRRAAPVTVLVVLAALGLGAYYQYRERAQARTALPAAAAAAAPGAVSTHYSPGDNLEQLDAEALGRAQRSVDIAMYAFTNKFLAEELRALARRGVRIRLYRDRSQYEQEQRNAAEHDDTCATDLLRGEANVEIRVKRARGRNIMHLKSFLVDGALLREGSANWSPAGLKAQDNNATYTTDPALVRHFQQAFEQMWERGDNVVVQ